MIGCEGLAVKPAVSVLKTVSFSNVQTKISKKEPDDADENILTSLSSSPSVLVFPFRTLVAFLEKAGGLFSLSESGGVPAVM